MKFDAIGGFLHVWAQQWGLFGYWSFGKSRGRAEQLAVCICWPTLPWSLVVILFTRKPLLKVFFQTCKLFSSYVADKSILLLLDRTGNHQKPEARSGQLISTSAQNREGYRGKISDDAGLALMCLSFYFMWRVENKSIMSGYRMMCLEGARWSTGQPKVNWPEPSSWRRVRVKRKDSPRTAR